MTPKLYIQYQGRKLKYDFCWSAKMGAEERGISVRAFEDYTKIPSSPYNVVVGSVEQCQGWLQANNYEVPAAIDILAFVDYLGREINIVDFEALGSLDYPCFIKPYSDIKKFTGFVANSYGDAIMGSESHRGSFCAQGVVDIVSEYRLYITNHSIVGMKHYLGDCLRFPDPEFIKKCFERSKQLLDYHSYVLDFGVLRSGQTILIEPNDGWAIGNYGIEPRDYWLFCRNRWLQITGIRKKMDFVFNK